MVSGDVLAEWWSATGTAFMKKMGCKVPDLKKKNADA